MEIIMTTRSKISLLKEYFGLRDGDTAKDFMMEMKALSGEERLDLAQGVAKEMKLSAEDVDFTLGV